MQIKLLIRRHGIAVVCGLVLAGWVLLPSILFFERTGDAFKGIYPELDGDRLYYQARIHEVLDGHPEVNHPYFFEYKEVIYPQATGAERFVARLSQLLDLNVQKLQLTLDFISPLVIFILAYFIFYSLAPGRFTSWFLPLVVFALIPAGLAKPIHPQITFPLLLLFLLFWFLLIQRERHRWWYAAGSGAVLGLLFLTYFYHWSFLIVLIGLHGIGVILKKDYAFLKHYAFMLAIALVVGIPYFLLIINGLDAPFHAETAVRVGLYHSYFPETLPRLAIALVWFLFFLWFVRVFQIGRRPMTLVVASFLLANIIYPNHQIITGTIIQNANHWAFMPLFIYALSSHYMYTMVRERADLSSIGQKILLGIIAIWFIVPVARFATFSVPPVLYNLTRAQEVAPQRYGPVMDWISTNAEKDAVIFSHLEVMRLVPAYTHANVYYTDYAFNMPASDQEVAERALLSHFFEPAFFEDQNFGMNESTRILWTQPSQSERSTHRAYDALGIDYEKQYSLERERALVGGVYEDLQKEGWSIDLLKRYRVSYIIWDEFQHPEWRLEAYDELERVADINDFSVWRFIK